MKTKNFWIFAVFAILASTSALALNKCKDKQGKVIYTDFPCEGAMSINLSGAGHYDPGSPGTAQALKERLRVEKLISIENGQVALGMKADDVINSWGKPTKINSSVGSYGRHEQWVYDRGNFNSQYVYVDNGVVTSVQSSR